MVDQFQYEDIEVFHQRKGFLAAIRDYEKLDTGIRALESKSKKVRNERTGIYKVISEDDRLPSMREKRESLRKKLNL